MRFTDKTEGAMVLMAWPLAKHVLTAGWTYNDGRLHRAIDLRAETGTPVYAAEPGTVDWVQAWDGHSTSGNQSYGNIVRIRHADYKGKSLKTYYAHLSRILVKSGQSVTEGQLIGYSGNTGHSTGPHLHFEVRLGGNRSNPLSWLDGDFTCADDKIRAHLGSYTSVRRSDTALAAGAELHLTRCPLYVSSVAVSSAGTVTGTYYAWSAEVADGRVRITNRADRVGVSGQVTGWIDVAMAGVQTQPAADKPSSTGSPAEEDSKGYVYGIDVSRYQGDIDWAKVAASGVKFALLRAGSQNSSGPYIDPYFEQNYANAKAAGIAVGAYIYTYAETEAEQNDEILTILPALEGKTFEYPVFVDVEDKSLTGIGKAALTQLVKRYMDILDQKGFVPGWYSYTNYINSYLCPEVLADYPLWVADYRSSLGYTGDYHIWQYTSSGTVPGISGKVDLNRDYHHYIASTGAPAEEQPATPELHKLSISLPGADADKAAEIIRKAADLGLAPDVTVETLPASSGDIKTLTEMADAAGGVAAKV